MPDQPKFPVTIVIRPLLMHETIHLSLMASGRIEQTQHDEVHIDELAARLADAAPDLAALLGIAEGQVDVSSSAFRLG